jgi:ectoine hydroxylase-related dioxygenase (phytanoyl-CoA dioxygenase family)
MDKEFIERGFSAQPLDSTQIAQLDEQGFTVLENIIDPDWIEPLRQAFETIYAAEGTEAGKEVAQMEGVRRLADLVNKGEVFDQVYLQPTLLTAVYHILQRSFKLHSLNGHDPLHGHGMQTLHADSGEPCTPGGPYHVVNSMWMLDDFTTDNGGTRLVPGSHLRPGRIGDYVEDRNADHPEQIQLTGKAGCVAVFNGNVWHSSFINRNGAARRTLHCAFIAREHQQQTNQRQHLRPETAGRLSPLARYILEVD